jgi:hypothetical protein
MAHPRRVFRIFRVAGPRMAARNTAFIPRQRRGRQAGNPRLPEDDPMSRQLLPGLALASCLLAACAGPQIAGVEPIDGVISGECHTDMVRGAVGLSASAATVQRARIDSDSTEVQVVRGNGMRTGGASEPVETTSGGPRLTIQAGRNNAITGMSCS